MKENCGRENPKDNDLFFTCSLIDYIARKTKNTRKDVVNALGKERLEKIYELADIYQPEKEIKKNLDELSEMLKKNNKFVSAIQNSLEKTQQLFNNLMQKYFG